MVLSKTTIDRSVRYFPKSKQTKERDSKSKTIKAGSLPRKQNKNKSQNYKKFIKNVAAGYLLNLQKNIWTSIRIIIFEYV